MSERRRARVLVAVLVALAGLSPSAVRADVSKRACVDASTDGQTLRADDELIEARDKLRVCAADPCPPVVKTYCARWLSEVEEQIPNVIVRARDTAGDDVLDAQVTIDGRPSALGRPETLDPGEHVVVLRRANEASVEKKLLLVDGDRGRILTLELPLAPGSSDGARSGHGIPAGAWALGGVSLLAFGSFAVFAVEASNDLSDLRQTCSPHCTESRTSSGKTHATIADISLGVGIAAAGGAILWGVLGRTAGETPTRAAIFDVHPMAGGALGTAGFHF